jgi:maltose alpha-D-glucosyltransferase/alpha-amylase
MIGGYLQSAELLGRRTAELHLALASSSEDPSFAPEPLTLLRQRSIYQSMRGLAARVFPALAKALDGLSEPVRSEARSLLEREDAALARLRRMVDRPITGVVQRCHGDFHLGQVLYTGKDFVIIDFEGEPARPLTERRLKRSPLRDAAGLLRSFHYAAYAALRNQVAQGMVHAERAAAVDTWVRYWYAWVSAAFLRAYTDTAAQGPILPGTPEELQLLLDCLLLEKAMYEVEYELNHRPDWVGLPVRGMLQALEAVP